MQTYWPGAVDYNGAIQTPSHSFADPQLKDATPVTDDLGLPVSINGSFATVFELMIRGRKHCVRCFLRNDPKRRRRYELITEHLRRNPSKYLVPFEYIEKGVNVRGQWYPIIKMEWLNGMPLNQWVSQHIGNPSAIRRMADEFVSLLADLASKGIAHGDLSHGNLMVVNGELKLIDYDGMYVPTLAQFGSIEIGHPNFQHPRRTGHHFGPQLDNFSAWIIYTSLVALADEPALWSLPSSNEDNLILSKPDYVDPASSAVLRRLRSSGNPNLTRAESIIRSILQRDVDQVPPLESFTVEPGFTNDIPINTWWATPGDLTAVSPPPAPYPISTPTPIFETYTPPPAQATSPSPAPWIIAAASTVAAIVLFQVPGGEILASAAAIAAVISAARGLTRKKSEPSPQSRTVPVQGPTTQPSARVPPHNPPPTGQNGGPSPQPGIQQQIDNQDALLRAALQRIDHEEQQELDALTAKRRDLANTEAVELRSYTGASKNFDDELKKFRLENASIPGIPAAIRQRLASSGIETAADITATIANLPGIGRKRLEHLIEWRRKCEEHAQAAATGNPQKRIRAKFAARYEHLKDQERRVRESAEERRMEARAQHRDVVSRVRQAQGAWHSTPASGNWYD